jgi:hypothetical protein
MRAALPDQDRDRLLTVRQGIAGVSHQLRRAATEFIRAVQQGFDHPGKVFNLWGYLGVDRGCELGRVLLALLVNAIPR